MCMTVGWCWLWVAEQSVSEYNTSTAQGCERANDI